MTSLNINFMIKRYQSLVLGFLLISSSLVGQNYKKDILSRPVEGGTLYFIKPQSVPADPSSLIKASKLHFDVTYLSPGDSLTLNSTIRTATPYQLDEIHFKVTGEEERSYPVKILYAEPKGGKWEIRTTARIPYTVWCNFFSKDEPRSIVYTQGHSNSIAYQFRDKSLKRQKAIVTLLGQLISFQQQ